LLAHAMKYYTIQGQPIYQIPPVWRPCRMDSWPRCSRGDWLHFLYL